MAGASAYRRASQLLFAAVLLKALQLERKLGLGANLGTQEKEHKGDLRRRDKSVKWFRKQLVTDWTFVKLVSISIDELTTPKRAPRNAARVLAHW